MDRNNYKFFIWGVLLLVGIIVAGSTVARFHNLSDITAPEQKPHVQITLRGSNFKPNTDYSFRVGINQTALIIKSDSRGNIIASPILPFSLNQSDILSFVVTELDSEYLDTPELELKINTHSKVLSWAGRFFNPSEQLEIALSPISLSTTSYKSSTNADWSGHFLTNTPYKDIDLIGQKACILASDSEKELCISFSIFKSPEIIQVLTMGPNNAGPGDSDDPVSPFDWWNTPVDCSPYGNQLSLCDTAHVLGLQEDLYKTYYDFTRMTLQLTAGMMQQVGFIGTLFDGKNQLETQLLLWKRQEKAHDDYHPSEQLCGIASLGKDLAATDIRRETNTYAMSRILSAGDFNMFRNATDTGPTKYYRLRLEQFKENYCNPHGLNSSLRTYCDGLMSGDFARLDREINFSSLVGVPKTLEIDLTTNALATTADEEDVMNMGRLLFGHKPLIMPQPNQREALDILTDPEGNFIRNFQEYRSVSAIRNVARHSYANLIGMKSESSGVSSAHIVPLLETFGMPAADIDSFIGTNPSYFAQMHVLTKQMFQGVNFYTNLHTREANILRFETAMQALTLMSSRDRHEALLRKELALSLLIEMKLRRLQVDVDDQLQAMDNRI